MINGWQNLSGKYYIIQSNGTRWQFYFFNIWPLSTMKFAQKYKKLAKAGLTFCQILNKLAKNSQRLWKLCQSFGISPNLVTLVQKHFSPKSWFNRKHRVGHLYSPLPFHLKWWGHHTDHRVMEQEVYYLPALFMGWGVVERHLVMA